MVVCILICLGDYPGWGVRYAEVQNFVGRDEVVKAVHNFFDGGLVVPPMDVEDVNVVCAEFLEAGCHAEMKRLEVIACVVDLLLSSVRALIVGGVLDEKLRMSCVYGWRVDPTFVAITSWSRIPRFSDHSPMNSSEVSSWLQN